MITVTTAECFTHGRIAREIHAIAQDYEDDFASNYLDLIDSLNKECNDDIGEQFDLTALSVHSAFFIPTMSAVKDVLKIENPVEPMELIKDIKVYDDEGDRKMAVLMAEASKKITGADIAIGTTAGIGYGGIAVISDDVTIITGSDVYADLVHCNSNDLYRRQESGIEKTLKILVYLVNGDFKRIESLKDVEIVYR